MVHVALVSTFPPAQCGIGNYAQELVRALGRAAPDIRVTVVAEREGSADTDDVMRTWDRRGAWADEVAARLRELAPDVVHVQHEHGIFGYSDSLAKLLRRAGVPSTVTLHSVYDDRRARTFHRELGAVCDRLIVHQQAGMASVLAAHGVAPSRIAVIEHGTPELALPARGDARALLELPGDGPIALFFGFIHTGKRLHTAVAAFEQIAAKHPGARLVIAGRMREDNVFQKIYAGWLRGRMRAGIAAGRIVFRPGFVPTEHKPAYYAAADVIVLPHVQAYGSASGVLHEAIAARRAFVCTRGKKFAEAVAALADQVPEAFPAAGDRDAWAASLDAMLGSHALRARVAELASGLADATSWTASGQRHAELYRELAAARVTRASA